MEPVNVPRKLWSDKIWMTESCPTMKKVLNMNWINSVFKCRNWVKKLQVDKASELARKAKKT